MKLHLALPLLLSLDPCVAFSTRNLQEVANDTFVPDENFTMAIPMLFSAIWGNETELATVVESNETFIIPREWLRGGPLSINGTEFVKFDSMNDTAFALPSDFNLTEVIRFKNSTEIQPNFRGAGGDGNVTVLSLPDFFPIFLASTEENGTVFEEPVFMTLEEPDTNPFFDGSDPNVTLGQPVLPNFPGEPVPVVLFDNFEQEMPAPIPIAMENVIVVSAPPDATLPDVKTEAVPIATVLPIAMESVQVLPVVTSSGGPVTGIEGLPAWWSRIKALFPGPDVNTCKKRKNIAPPIGSKCSAKKDKMCFFGNQVCGGAPFPDTCCFCSGPAKNRTWTCKAEACPK